VNVAKLVGNGCDGSSSTKGPRNTKGSIANPRSSRDFCIGTVKMNSFVLIFVPCGKEQADIEAAFRKHVGPTESVEDPTANRSEAIDVEEQLPLWRWFTF
jgi:hypothetical protein